MKTCLVHQEALVAFIRDELGPLERAHLAAHLERCGRCRDVEARLSSTLSAARDWRPAVDEEHLARLERRLALATAPRRTAARAGLLVASLVAAGVVLAFVFGTTPPKAPDPAHAATPRAATPHAATPHAATPHAKTPHAATPHAKTPTLTRAVLTPRLHAVSGDRWDGRVTQATPNEVRVEMERGFAVMAFQGGEGRRLTVVAPRVSVEVIGTQFFVRVLEDGATAVGVLSGRVRVVHDGGSEIIGAGTARRYAEGRPPEPATPGVQPEVDAKDPFLADHGHPEPPAKISEARADDTRGEAHATPLGAQDTRAPGPPRTAASVPRRETAEPFSPGPRPALKAEGRTSAEPAVSAVLAEAEREALAGRVDRAIATLQAASVRTEAPFVARRGLIQYETARLLAFSRRAPGDDDAARAIFESLGARGAGEVAVQSRFALCELERSTSPCAAVACLEKIRDGSTQQDVRAEAEIWATRWRNERGLCEDHK